MYYEEQIVDGIKYFRNKPKGKWRRVLLPHEKPPAILFDGFAVLEALDDKAKTRTSAENVSDVLDAVVRLMRSNVEVRGRPLLGDPS